MSDSLRPRGLQPTIIHSFHKYLLNTYCVPGVVIGIGIQQRTRKIKVLELPEQHFLGTSLHYFVFAIIFLCLLWLLKSTPIKCHLLEGDQLFKGQTGACLFIAWDPWYWQEVAVPHYIYTYNPCNSFMSAFFIFYLEDWSHREKFQSLSDIVK